MLKTAQKRFNIVEDCLVCFKMVKDCSRWFEMVIPLKHTFLKMVKTLHFSDRPEMAVHSDPFQSPRVRALWSSCAWTTDLRMVEAS